MMSKQPGIMPTSTSSDGEVSAQERHKRSCTNEKIKRKKKLPKRDPRNDGSGDLRPPSAGVVLTTFVCQHISNYQWISRRWWLSLYVYRGKERESGEQNGFFLKEFPTWSFWTETTSNRPWHITLTLNQSLHIYIKQVFFLVEDGVVILGIISM